MANFAELDDQNIVVRVVRVGDEDAPDPAPEISEPAGIAFLESLGLGSSWRQTSFSGSFRKRFASRGYKYDPVADVFIPPKPWPSWKLTDDYDWMPPVPVPEEDGITYDWDEDNQVWVPLNG